MRRNVHAISLDDEPPSEIDPAILRLAEGIRSAEAVLADKIEQRDRLSREIAVLTKALAGHRLGFARGRAPRAPRSKVKDALLALLDERGSHGLNAQIACDLSAQRGERIHRGTVSSLLSRLKNDNVVTYDGSVYRLKGAPALPRERRES